MQRNRVSFYNLHLDFMNCVGQTVRLMSNMMTFPRKRVKRAIDLCAPPSSLPLAGKGGWWPPQGFSRISLERVSWSGWNLAKLYAHPFYTYRNKCQLQVEAVNEVMTSYTTSCSVEICGCCDLSQLSKFPCTLACVFITCRVFGVCGYHGTIYSCPGVKVTQGHEC